MQPDQIAVTITRRGSQVTARTSAPPDQNQAADAPDQEHGYARLTTPLRQRGLVCTVEYGLSDYLVHAELPDGSALVISPPQEPATDHSPGRPGSWLVTRSHPYGFADQEVLYNSEPGGAQARHGGRTAPLLAAVDARLDQLGLPVGEQRGAVEPLNAADAVLHRAGFVSEVTYLGRFHLLPAGMTDPAEQRHAVTLAVDMLGAEGFAYTVEADLLDSDMPVRTGHPAPVGDHVARLTWSVSEAGHTGQVVAALSELTAPGEGVLDRLTEALDVTADWWEGLGAPTDPLYAASLRRITRQVGVSFQEIQNLRSELANRHTEHPLYARQGRTAGPEPRVAAALAVSPAARRTPPPAAPASPVPAAAPPAAHPSSAPGR